MRVAILTHSSERHYYFCNQIIEKTGSVVEVITNGKHAQKANPEELKKEGTIKALENKFRRGVRYTLRNKVMNFIFRRYMRKFIIERDKTEQEYFGGSREHFYKNHSNLLLARVDTSRYASINGAYYVNLIRKAKPDIIVVMGTCLLGKEIIDSAQYVVNMHTGLSPYYRGGNSNMWPIINNDFGYFGVTIHMMSPGIDSGDIIYTDSPEISLDDNYGTIRGKCIVIGTDLMVKAIRDIESGKIRRTKQWVKGKLYLNRDMNGYIAFKYLRSKKRYLAKYCELAKGNQLAGLKLFRPHTGGARVN